MGYGIPSSAILVVCLILADCDLDLSVAEVMGRVEQYQQLYRRRFGVTDEDLQSALCHLAAHSGICSYPDLLREGPPSVLGGIRLRDLIGPILRYNDVWFNDEGEYWTEDTDLAGSEYDYTAYNRPLREFFANPSKHTRQAVVEFFDRTGVGEEGLLRASRPA